ncbi:MAG: EamA family transporter [Deltaproteobacteria bacterium]|nr:EamA family transporter [Deltaproteobacteria bacterium]
MCSIASYILLFYLTRIGTAAKVSSLVYLTPPFAMIMSYFLFGDIMGLSGIIGTIIVIIGVILVNYEYRLKRQNLYGCHGG